ncbi:MAG: cbb3-type cytochrome oxidase assembly protein CcoS [Acetobacteraceae bacterium]|jgi:cbb3-type cytochrome oxidase maturation protein|nr:cbb3-type cytochrome oxidase assembly protein CcoS [Acetobacteraceae bacterium]
MDALILLIPLSLALGGAALAAFLWTMRSGQYEDLDAAAYRILFDEDTPRPRAVAGQDEPRQDPPRQAGTGKETTR